MRLLPLVAVVLTGCTGPAAPPPPESQDTDDLVRRHYDQACRVETGRPPAIMVSEIFDTLGLAQRLAEVDAPPLPRDGRSQEVQWRTLEFITRYGRDGEPTVAGIWATTLDSAAARLADSVLTARIRPLPALLESEGFRTVVVFTPLPAVDVGPPIMCLPHIQHEPDRRPAGLPLQVSTWLEFRSPERIRGSALTATLRIGLDRRGRVASLDPIAGDSVTVTAAREVVDQLSFDPALRNGEAIVGALVQSFAFPPGYLPGR